MSITLVRGNDQVVILPGLSTQLPPVEYQNAATVTGTVLDSTGAPIVNYINLPFLYVEGSNGNYELAIKGDKFWLPASARYTMVITAIQENLNYRTVVDVTVTD